MIKGKKVIGICLTRLYGTTISNYISRLHNLAKKQGYKLIVFNSFLDFYHGDAFDSGARAIYDIINYDIIDALIVYAESFCDDAVFDSIVEGAKSKNVPIILINKELEGCFSVMRDPEKAFKDIIRHIIKDHGVTDSVFIAGKRDGDIESVRRIQCYRDVLEENGLVFDEKKVEYGEYWEKPTRAIMEKMLYENRLPKAVICANDVMAVTVCEVLRQFGYKVPRDVLVTGFDGIPAARYNSPQLTTCNENLNGLAELSIEAVRMMLEEGLKSGILYNSYSPVIAESCGCKQNMQDDFRMDAEFLFHALNNMEVHEEHMYNWIDRMLGIKDMNSFYNHLAGCMFKDSYVCLNKDFVAFVMKSNEKEIRDGFSDELVMISSIYNNDKNLDNTEIVYLRDMVPFIDEWVTDDTMYVLTAVYAENKVCGYYAVQTSDLMTCRHKIKRVSKTINIACNVTLNYYGQVKLQKSVENANMVNSVTGLPNLKGTVAWFEEYTSVKENYNKALSVSVYGLPKYTYIYENYGVEDIEEVLCFVAESLKIANPVNCFIGHIAEDEFVVINYYDDPYSISDVINKATSVFYSVIEGYNSNSDKEYYIEVNGGCTVMNPGWTGTIESFIKYANNEMYMNRLKLGAGNVMKEQTAPKEHYKTIEILIQKNLFHYHFQPIVNAKSGEIYGYEALMRTDERIGMNPLEVLSAAKEFNYLYDIEKATMFNVMERYAKERSKFGQKKIFINTIPGHFLKEEDLAELVDKYGQYMENVVFELTEQNTVSDEELSNIKKLTGDKEVSQIAIDDYGAGHSNIVNLLRYSPQLIKIDRFLVTDIHKDNNKQMFVKSTIDFARMNNIKVLAEGVETSNEMCTLIDLGVDLIQGYYTGRPVSEPILTIAEEIRKEILDANPLFGKRYVV